jgi:hypothetical protein
LDITGMLGNTSTMTNLGLTTDFWIGIANLKSGTVIDDLMDDSVYYNASYYTCGIRNASIPTNVIFVDNVQSLHVGTIRELEFNLEFNYTDANPTSPFWALQNYDSFGTLLYSHFLGYVVNDLTTDVPNGGNITNGSNISYGGDWNTTVDQTILGNAADFSAMTAAFRAGGLEPGAITQDKNFTVLLEEFALNISLSLMSKSAFW